MRLKEGIVLDMEGTFGELKFSALRREVRVQDEDGTATEEIKRRTYDLRSRVQGMMIQVSVPATVALKEYDYGAVVELVNPVIDTACNPTYRGADVIWYLNVDDIVLSKSALGQRPQEAKKEPFNQDKQDKK